MRDDDEFYEHARNDLFPKMKESVLSIVIAQDPDPKLCLELGAAILFDKPIVVLVPVGEKLPSNLARLASAVVQGDVKNDVTKQRLEAAISKVIANDKRTKVKQ
jgi:hypothetical protein